VVANAMNNISPALPPWLARLSIDVPVINPAQVISMFLPGITKLRRKLLLLNLRIGREVRIRRDAYEMVGNDGQHMSLPEVPNWRSGEQE
jgi:hypothetical protein